MATGTPWQAVARRSAPANPTGPPQAPLLGGSPPITRRGILRTLTLGAVASVLAACAQAPAASQPTTTAPAAGAPAAATAPTAAAKPAAGAAARRLTIALATEISGWSPYSQSGGTGYAMWMNVMEALVVQTSVDGRIGYAPLLAERWESTDAKKWTFYLRKGVSFTDGTPFTADDVLHSYNRIMNDSDSLQGPQLKSFISNIRVVDPSTVEMNLKAASVSFLEEVRLRVVTSKAQFDKLGKDAADKAPLGTGAYTFREWIRGQRFVVAKNPAYWGAKPDPDEIVTRFITDDVGRVTALNNGEIDIADSLSPQLAPQVGNRARVLTEDSERHMFLGMRPDTPPTNNILVRQAIYQAIDRDVIVDRIQGGFARVLTGPLQSFVLGYDPTLPAYYPFDPAKAKALLAQAGLPDGVSLDLYVPVTQYVKAKEVGEAVASMLRDVGITANIKSPEWGTFQTEYADGKYGFYLIGRGNTADPSSYLTQYFRTGASNRLGYGNPDLDKLIDAQNASSDSTERVRQLAQIQRGIMDDAPAVFLYTYKSIYGVANRVDWKPLTNEFIHGYTAKIVA